MNKPLYEYLENARKLENDIYACDVTIDKLSKNIYELNRKIEDTERERYTKNRQPERPKSDSPRYEESPEPPKSFLNWKSYLIIMFISIIVSTMLYALITSPAAFFAQFFDIDTQDSIILTPIGSIIILGISLIIPFIITHYIDREPFAKYKQEEEDYLKRKQAKEQECENRYQVKLKEYEKQLQEYKKELDTIPTICRNQILNYEKRIDDITKQKAQIRQVLDQYYSANIVYPKYRGLIPITMFCEYIDSGRCTTLEGHEGAYNIYENELRQNIIITKLDGITNKLDSIKSSQYLLYNAITDANNISNRLVSSFSSYADQQAQANAMQLISNRAVVDSNNALKSLAEKNLEELRNLTR